jgi:hypothetical protein
MTACAACGQQTSDERDFCAHCGSYLRWDEPESGDAPTAVLYEPQPDEPPTTVMEVEPPRVEAPTEAVRVSLARPDDPGAGAEPPSVRVEAGGRARLVGIVFNQSGIVDSYDLRIAGLDPSWWTITPATVDLVPFGSSDGVPDQRVEIALHPPRAPEAEARAWEIALIARSRTNDSDAAAGTGTLTIEPFEQIDCRVRPQTIRDQRSGRLDVPVRNLGNAPVEVYFEGEDDEGALSFEFTPSVLMLDPGSEGHAQVTVSARSTVRGAAGHRRLTIVAEGGRERVERQATFIQEPVVERSHRFEWRVGLTLLSAFLLIVGSLLKWDSDGDKGLCTQGASNCLTFDHYLDKAGIATVDPLNPDHLVRLISAVTSIGILAVILGVLVLLGARKGGLTWFAGCLAILLAIVMFATLGAGGIGVWFVLLGGACAVAAGALARG